MNVPRRQFSDSRKLLYYAALALSVIGLLLFLSTFVTFIANFGNFDHFEARARSIGFRAFGGIILLMLGGVLGRIASRGWAGSGVILDPEKARSDVEPWSRMAGAIINDAISEAGASPGSRPAAEPREPQVKIRCQKCQALNDEGAQFCNQCGAAI
jgi:RNA polymerase subunit RPABC4/transcription elongation factor Spt4